MGGGGRGGEWIACDASGHSCADQHVSSIIIILCHDNYVRGQSMTLNVKSCGFQLLYTITLRADLNHNSYFNSLRIVGLFQYNFYCVINNNRYSLSVSVYTATLLSLHNGSGMLFIHFQYQHTQLQTIPYKEENDVSRMLHKKNGQFTQLPLYV